MLQIFRIRVAALKRKELSLFSRRHADIQARYATMGKAADWAKDKLGPLASRPSWAPDLKIMMNAADAEGDMGVAPSGTPRRSRRRASTQRGRLTRQYTDSTVAGHRAARCLLIRAKRLCRARPYRITYMKPNLARLYGLRAAYADWCLAGQ